MKPTPAESPLPPIPAHASSQQQQLALSHPIQTFLADLAATHRIHIVAGTIAMAQSSAEHDEQKQQQPRFFNSLLVFDPRGAQIARYDKIHLFRFAGPPAFDEAETIISGIHSKFGRAVDVRISANADLSADDTVALEEGAEGLKDEFVMRLSVCYDLRFPELFRAKASKTCENDADGGYNVIVVPAAFTVETGKAHWECLLRARAIENQAYVIAAAQGGIHPVTGRVTYGHTMIIDPWGNVVAEVAEDGEGLAVWELDMAVIENTRKRLPALSHRLLG
ncbi:hypothetical protein HDU82_004662 [Entophlyctis luteolus]|nr:hypothetical protein HDU82_004662 [Entophlyctis luteolus]